MKTLVADCRLLVLLLESRQTTNVMLSISPEKTNTDTYIDGTARPQRCKQEVWEEGWSYVILDLVIGGAWKSLSMGWNIWYVAKVMKPLVRWIFSRLLSWLESVINDSFMSPQSKSRILEYVWTGAPVVWCSWASSPGWYTTHIRLVKRHWINKSDDEWFTQFTQLLHIFHFPDLSKDKDEN